MSSLKRRLAAIVFTDIVGFTNLSSKDEEGAYKLVVKQREILKPIVEKHEGQWLKEEGDALLLSFPSTKEAVNCSIQIQEAVKNVDDLILRIGIHQGDIIQEDKDVFGDDVNIASRIEPFAAPGGIAVSQKIQQDLSSNPEFKFKFIDKPKLKGVQQEISVYCIVSHGLPESKKSQVRAKVEPKKKYYKEILISTLFGIIIFSYLPQFFKSGNTNFLQSSLSQMMKNKNALISDLNSTKHEKDILYELNKADSLLALNTPEHNNEVIANIEMLIAIDNTQGDYYSLLGQAYYQRWKFNIESEEFILEAMKNTDIAIQKKNINVEYLALTYMTISDIWLSKENISLANEYIKKAIQVKRLSPITERFKKITLLNLQKMEFKK
jgi:class 3 adenylate cyclase